MPEPTTAVNEPTDAELIERCRCGDERAVTMLVRRYAEPIARFVASLGEREEVEEVVQDTFVRAVGSLDGFRGDSSLRSWLFAIARNLVRDRGRGRARKFRIVPIEEDHAVTAHDALDSAVSEETERRLGEALATLSPMQREVFALRVSEGLSYREIATALGSTEGAARVHYHNAMKALREFIDA